MRKKSYGVKGIRVENGRVVYRPYIPVHQRHEGIRVDSRGQLTPPIRLGKPSDDDSLIMANYLAAEQSIKQQLIADRNTLNWINKAYQDSRQFKELAPATQKAAYNNQKVLEHPIKIDGEPKTVGDLHISKVTKPLFQGIAERRLQLRKKDGRKGNASVNREIAYLSSMLTWATNYVTDLGIDHNPLKGFKRLPEQGRTRHVTDTEYWQQYEIAAETPENGLCILFELTLGLAARGVEVLSLKLSDCTDEGIYVERKKGSRDNIIEWAKEDTSKQDSRLWKAYQGALERHKPHKILPIDPPLLLTRKGERLSPSGLQSAMQRLKRKMEERGLGNVYWTMHQLKHKAITEAEDKSMGGHKTEAMRNKYDHSVTKHKPGI